ncbi:MAG: tyrosine-type recombinase/integrase [Gemmatimonadaceae bacterium]
MATLAADAPPAAVPSALPAPSFSESISAAPIPTSDGDRTASDGELDAAKRVEVAIGHRPFTFSSGGITMSEIMDGYMLRPQFAKSAVSTQDDAKSRDRILRAGLGAATRVESIDNDILAAYASKRLDCGIKYRVALRTRSGRILPERERVTPPTSQRSVEADLKLLTRACKWAARKRTGNGIAMLSVDPFAGYKIVGEKNTKRPVASHDRFEQMIRAANELAALAENTHKRHVFELFALALVVLEGTGRRISAVLGLTWGDLENISGDADTEPRIRFLADLDKSGVERSLPLDPRVAAALCSFRARHEPLFSHYVFPNRYGTNTVTPDNMAHIFRQVEAHAGLPPLDGGQYHPYRRKFATERKHLPHLVVMHLMGIKDLKTFVECYAQVSDTDMSEALRGAVRLRDTSLERSKRRRKARSGSA